MTRAAPGTVARTPASTMVRTMAGALATCSSLLVFVAACSDARDAATPAATPSATSPAPAPGQDDGTDPCDLLPADAAEALAGEPMTQSRVADVGGMPACQMSGATRGIQVAQVPAEEWAETVPGLIDQLRATQGLGSANQARLNEMADKLEDSRGDAMAPCDLFSIMAEYNGTPEGQSWTVAYVPDGKNPQGLSAQSCADGTYTSVLLAGSGIVPSADLGNAIRAALELVASS